MIKQNNNRAKYILCTYQINLNVDGYSLTKVYNILPD